LPWIPLMQGGDAASIIEEWKQLLLAEPDVERRADFAGLALVFAEAAGCRPIWKQALMEWNVETSQQVLEWQAEALQRGLAEGKAKGKVEGKAEGKAEDLLKVLRLRFVKKLPKKLQQKILQTTDLAQLDQWLDLSLTADTLDAFREASNL
jgi:predicted transposase YdaD